MLLDVQRFESSQEAGATIDIVWVVSAEKEGIQAIGRTFKREPLNSNDSGNGYEALAAAHGHALADVSRDIAAVIKEKVNLRR